MGANTLGWDGLTSRIAVAVATVCLTSFVYKLIKMRLMFYRLRKKGLPTPPWNPILGNLAVMAQLQKKGPSDSREAESFALLSTEAPGCEAGFYVDVWPFSIPMLVVTSPALAVQACQTYDLPKPDVLQPFINPMAGGSDNLFVSNGAHWKQARELFNHGFSMAAAMSHMTYILEEAQVFVQMLKDHARKGDTFSLDALTCRYVMDIIGNVALNTRFRFQEQHNPIAAAMRDTIELECGIETSNFLSRWNPRRLYRQWQNGRTMDYLIGVELDKRYKEWRETAKSSSHPRTQSIMDMVIAEYMKTRPQAQQQQELDPEFKRWATIQIRLFLFVGHDSEATTIIYSLYLLSKNPEVLIKVRAEHDRVFGAGVSSAYDVLTDHPEKINQLSYTHAVIKETLRLFPPANGLRGGLPGVSLRDEQGRIFPTEGCAIWIVHTAVHRNPSSWPQPHAFIPDRWLVEPGHPLYPPAGGWRPFEQGPRNCIGQNISLLGIKASLAMLVRQFDFHDAYAEYDRLHPSTGLKTMFGERAYMIQKGAGHPAQGFPCKVTLR
ncbi:cytochrome P450 monooxygenase [Aspergillus flavus]|uniref:Cytochrome P450 monooxygenase n=2 Tax=Aspergillus flavus TaxID=5059 RepID=B8N0Z3_ASPFN|nr:uncharacterized protein G4B84_003717 [Aspergillus flavus NRRL3357]KOC17230.1 putative N-alkane-inducible cytochrome P450 [Aspergillus flavus AF70]QRD82927.1 cytochrome P450 monooxygenase [Aspergillus flavus]KAF7618979.1 hypothetical protein AFLA_000622 [Aspergillus flavus NRRL3357]QMW28428.1 hypothetical protein G4B84_003717 [Aspergillus flavus NRRL3357]RAQ63570.1 N-alkane-inducible cytochrome P450 [Aspergillus flavus]